MARKLYALAERADWYGWRPRCFWRWLLAYYDKRAGLYGPQP